MKKTLIFISGFMIFGCSVTPVRSYQPQYNTRQLLENHKNKFKVVGVTSIDKVALDKELACRALSFEFLGKVNYVDYFKNALISELENARALAENGSQLDVVIEKIELDSFDGYWIIRSLSRVNSKDFLVETSFNFPFVFMGNEACNTASSTLADATAEHINSIIKSALENN